MNTARNLPSHVLDAMVRAKGGRVAADEPKREKKRARRGVMNGTETRHAANLELRKRAGDVRWFAFEPITLRLATGAKYVPDFAVLLADGSLEFHETKGGFIREAALVRIKVAASLYPFRFVLVRELEPDVFTYETVEGAAPIAADLAR